MTEKFGENEFLKGYNALLETIATQNSAKQEELLQNQRLEEQKKRFLSAISNSANSFLQEEDGIYYIYGFRSYVGQYGPTFILVGKKRGNNSKEENGKGLEQYYAPYNVTEELNKQTSNPNFKTKLEHEFVDKKGTLYYTLGKIPILVLEKRGTYTTKTRNQAPRIIIRDCIQPKKETDNKNEQLFMRYPIHNPRINHSKKLEDLEEGVELEIVTFKPHGRSGFIGVKTSTGEVEDYIANPWVKQLLQEKGRISENGFLRDDALIMKLLTGPMKTTPSKNKCRTVYS
jgi:hypothetical protein